MLNEEESKKKLGNILTVLGIILYIICIINSLNGIMQILSNLLFLSGIYLNLGLMKFRKLFSNNKNSIGTILLCIGIFLVVVTFKKIGILFQLSGYFMVFKGFIVRLIKRNVYRLPK